MSERPANQEQGKPHLSERVVQPKWIPDGIHLQSGITIITN